MSQSPELAGGAGFTFADRVATRYLAALLHGSGAVGLADRKVIRVALEQRDAGEPLDDIVVDGEAPDGSVARLSLQVKREITISAAASNQDFREIIRDSWATIDKPDFRMGLDRVGAVVGVSTAVGKSRDLIALGELAKASATPVDFAVRFAIGGSASNEQRTVLEDLQTITRALDRPANVEAMHSLLRHLVLIRFDALHEGATDDAATVALLEQSLAPGQAGQASALADRLLNLARVGAGKARSWDRDSLRLDVAPWFNLAEDRWLAADLSALLAKVRLDTESIRDRIGDVALDRPAVGVKVAQALTDHKLVTLRGPPGSGKSVMLRREVQAALNRGPALLLKADRLTGSSWAQYAVAIGLTQVDAVPLLREIAAIGTSTLFIDGLDRIDKAQRGIVVDLFNALESRTELSGWRVLATMRDSGVEPVRTWLPRTFDSGRMTTVEVGPLIDEEAEELATAKPALRSLLFGPDPVRTLIRRPFFAMILNEAVLGPGTTPQSEIELMSRWWSRGGFDAEGVEALLRQRTLLQLVRLRALQPDTSVPLESLDPMLLASVEALRNDGVVVYTSDGHSAHFAHDIYFEWSFAQALFSERDNWISLLRSSGEPPVVGRAVDLRGQAMFVADPNAWNTALAQLSDPALRGQWHRTWLLAPLHLPDFSERSAHFTAAIEVDDYALMRSALVWFQAQHTVPNPSVLDGSLGEIVDRDTRVRAADLLGGPDDFQTWIQFLHYLGTQMGAIPRRLFPQVVTLFEVWQNALADLPNRISAMIVEYASSWLAELEHRDKLQGRLRRDDKNVPQDTWECIENIDEFVRALRCLVLRAGRVEPERVAGYLRMFESGRAASKLAFEDINGFAPLLSRWLPTGLVDFTLNYLRRELPEEQRNRRIEEDRRSATYRNELRLRREESLDWGERMSVSHSNFGYGGPSRWEWETLSLERDSFNYFPASPLHQPFQALFENAQDEALRLVCSMSNHAVEAWRQLHRLQPDFGTPVPIKLDFPWGHQIFWGGVREYLWSRGLWAPKPLASAYLALDKWAIEQADAGVDSDTLIERIVRGNDSIAALGIALHVALARPSISPVNEALVTCQRLWSADMQRYVQEAGIRSSSQIGFRQENQRRDAMAVEALNTLPVRAEEIRSLAMLHVLQSDAVAAQRVRDAIKAFADAPDFELEERPNHPAAWENASEQARTYAAWGELSNYRRLNITNQPEHQAIVVDNPVLDEPGVRERLEEGQEHLLAFALFNWADKSFEKGSIADDMTLDRAIASARSLDSGTIFQRSFDGDQISMRQGAVAGAAAVIVAFAPEGKDIEWARGVLARAAKCPEEGGPLWSSVGIVSWHHVIFVARAAAADLRRDPNSRQHAVELLSTLIHPLDNVGLEASGVLASLWDVAPKLCWVGLGLALDICIVGPDEISPNLIHDPGAGAGARQHKLVAAIAKLDIEAGPLPVPPTPWLATAVVGVRRRKRALTSDADEVANHWRSADGWWRSARAGEILKKQPVREILASSFEGYFVSYCEVMLSWTIERLAPVWASHSREVERADVLEWTHEFGDVLGQLVGLLEPRRAETNFIATICAVEDEDTCFDLLMPLVRSFICEHVLDSAEIATISPVVLERSLDRLLAAPTFCRTSYRAGELNGFSKPRLARWLMFVGIERAELSHRYCNGDWSELPIILPTIDRFIRTAGWVPTVLQDFLTLAERARDHYPPEAFADAILSVLSSGGDLEAHWRGTTIAARIASRIQDIADRASPLPLELGQKLLRILDMLIDQGDRRSAALQISPAFRDLRVITADRPPTL
ncbi:MAG: hypothetical protein ACOVN5_09570 [Aquidulcibacter sp.]